MKFQPGNTVRYTDEFLKGIRLFPPPDTVGVRGIVVRSKIFGQTEIVTVELVPKEGKPYTAYIHSFDLQKEK